MAKKWKERLILPAFLLLLLVFGLLMLIQHRQAPAPVAEPAPAATLPPREVLLYFIAANGSHLAEERRQLPGCAEERSCLLDTVAALLKGPREAELQPLFSLQTTAALAGVVLLLIAVLRNSPSDQGDADGSNPSVSG